MTIINSEVVGVVGNIIKKCIKNSDFLSDGNKVPDGNKVLDGNKVRLQYLIASHYYCSFKFNLNYLTPGNKRTFFLLYAISKKPINNGASRAGSGTGTPE